MADFCYTCLPHVFPEIPPEDNDLRDEALLPGQTALALCEGCGLGFFDREGKRITPPPTPYPPAS